MRRVYFLIFVLLTFTACTTKTIRYSTLEEIQKNIVPNRSTLPAYDLTGGVWVKGQPLLINHEFDFGSALGIPDIGPAIAAGKRKKENEEAAKLFEEMPSLSPNTLFQDHLKRLNIKKLNDYKITLYGILFGQPDAHLRVILEIKNNKIEGDPLRFIYVTEWLLIKGENSWNTEKGKKITESFQEAIPHLIEMWRHDSTHSGDSKEVEYTVIGGKVPQRGSGWILSKKHNRMLIKSKNILNTTLSYSEAEIKIQNRTDYPGIPH